MRIPHSLTVMLWPWQGLAKDRKHPIIQWLSKNTYIMCK